MIIAEVIYPDCNGEYGFDEPWDYTPIINALGDVILRVDEDDYQGDTWVLLRSKENDKYGFLNFGWGSCCGCDALQACNSYAELQELIDQLEQTTIWFDSAASALIFFQQHDWKGDYCWHSKDFHTFLNKVTALLAQETVSKLSAHLSTFMRATGLEQNVTVSKEITDIETAIMGLIPKEEKENDSI